MVVVDLLAAVAVAVCQYHLRKHRLRKLENRETPSRMILMI
jgi:hypothetical protein